jgi:NitT/TauT family transport system permease protein
VVVVIAGWEFATRVAGVPALLLPDLRDVAGTLWATRQSVLDHTLVTLQRTAAGLAVGIVVGVALGLAVGYSAIVYAAVYPLVTAFYCIPKQALVPIFVMWAGFGTLPAVITAVITAFFPVMVNVATGVSTINPDLADLLRSFGGRKRQIFLKVGIPSSLPYFFSSLRIAGIGALIGVVVSEMIASREGIGYMVLMAGAEFRTPLLFAYVVTSALLGVAIYAVFAFADRRLAWWAYRGNR